MSSVPQVPLISLSRFPSTARRCELQDDVLQKALAVKVANTAVIDAALAGKYDPFAITTRSDDAMHDAAIHDAIVQCRVAQEALRQALFHASRVLEEYEDADRD